VFRIRPSRSESAPLRRTCVLRVDGPGLRVEGSKLRGVRVDKLIVAAQTITTREARGI
jgi:hypothetical protein